MLTVIRRHTIWKNCFINNQKHEAESCKIPYLTCTFPVQVPLWTEVLCIWRAAFLGWPKKQGLSRKHLFGFQKHFFSEEDYMKGTASKVFSCFSSIISFQLHENLILISNIVILNVFSNLVTFRNKAMCKSVLRLYAQPSIKNLWFNGGTRNHLISFDFPEKSLVSAQLLIESAVQL